MCFMNKRHIQAPKIPFVKAFRGFTPGLIAALICSATGLSLLSSAGFAAETRPVLSSSELTEILREPSVGAKVTGIQVVGSGPDITVLAAKEASSGERDLKIDAIFLAKAVFQHAAGQVNKVKVLYSQADHEGRYVSITSKEILDYGSGKINAEQLLSSLRLVPVAAERAPDVVAGPQFERRLLVWQRIEKLRQQGTGVTPFETIFAEIDGMVKAGTPDPSKKIAYIESKLAEQEEALKQAKRTARGLGVPASKNSLTSTSPSQAQQSGSTGAQSSIGSGTGSGNSVGYLPQDHQFIRQVYHNRAESLVSLAKTKDRKAAEELETLKKQIDKAFSDDRKPEAFALMRKFQILVKQVTNTDMLGPPEGSGPPGGQGGGQGGGPNGGGPNGGGPP